MANFSDDFYVLQNRLRLFAPLSDDFSFAVDKTDGAELVGNTAGMIVALNKQFNYNWDSDRTTPDTVSADFTYRNAKVRALTLGENATYLNRFGFNGVANDEINRCLYTASRQATVCFWMYCLNATDIAPGQYRPSNNFTFAESMNNGMTFGMDTCTIAMAQLEAMSAADQASQIKKYELTMLGQKLSDIEVIGKGETGNYASLTGRWVLAIYSMDFGTSATDGVSFELNLRYSDIESGNPQQLRLKQTNMYQALWSPNTVRNGQWGIGVPINEGKAYTNRVAIRNVMVYNALLDVSQQNRIFNNGIDPYDAGNPSTYDFDQHDRKLWGNFGIFGTRSNIRIEKSRFSQGKVDGTNTQMPFSSYRKDNMAVRDNTLLAFVGENSTYNITNFDTLGFDGNGSTDETGANYDKDSVDTTQSQEVSVPDVTSNGAAVQPTILAWRNSEVTGFRAVDNYRIWLTEGATLSGFPNAVMISSQTHPEDLPSGTFVAALNYNATDYDPSGGQFTPVPGRSTLKGYPIHIGSLKYPRDLAQIGYSSNAPSEIFFQNCQKYEMIAWDKANTGTPADVAYNWAPVTWRYVVYEVEVSSELGDSTNSASGKWQGAIRMYLFSQNFNAVAVYTKPYVRKYKSGSSGEHDYQNWFFSTFNCSDDFLAAETARRQYLPRMTVPQIKVPVLASSITLTTKSQQQASTDTVPATTGAISVPQKSFVGGAIEFYESSLIGKQYSVSNISPTGTTVAGQIYWEGNFITDYRTNRYFSPVDSGWYEVQFWCDRQASDNNYTFMVGVWDLSSSGGKNAAQNMRVRDGDFVGGGSVGGAPCSPVVNLLIYLTAGVKYGIAAKVTGGGSTRSRDSWTANAQDISVGDGFQFAFYVKRTSVGGSYLAPAVTGASMEYNASTDPRVSKYLIQDSGGQWLLLQNIEAQYTGVKQVNPATTSFPWTTTDPYLEPDSTDITYTDR